ncbi:MAG: endonuclease [Bacilli bacterium]|nr:endonuclease [Bacilli bacterium]
MKRRLFINLIGLALVPILSSCVVGTNPIDSSNGGSFTFSISGTLNKKSYDFYDEWDPTGLSFYKNASNGTKELIDPSKYTITFSPAKPRGFNGSKVNVVMAMREDVSQRATKSLTGLSVSYEPYDETVYNAEVAEYYTNVNLEQSSTNLLKELQKLTFKKHTTWVTYNNVAKYHSISAEACSTEQVPGTYNKELFYTGYTAVNSGGSREHVWPCSVSSGLWYHGNKSNPNDTSDVDNESKYVGGGSDLFHVRPSANNVNEKRGNAPFADLSSYSNTSEVGDGRTGTKKLKGTGSNSYGQFTKVEPDDSFKGDVARIIAYVYMHYHTFSGVTGIANYNDLTSSSLSLNSVVSASNIGSLLKKWDELDPPSEVEKYRNHTVMGIQGNRNPFIDIPGLVGQCFA